MNNGNVNINNIEQETNDPELTGPLNLKIACIHLRHKLMHCDDRHATPGLVDDSSDTRTFYCVHTQAALGPDDESVSPDECTPSRTCYQEPPHAKLSHNPD